jgi:hypothetical protein
LLWSTAINVFCWWFKHLFASYWWYWRIWSRRYFCSIWNISSIS